MSENEQIVEKTQPIITKAQIIEIVPTFIKAEPQTRCMAFMPTYKETIEPAKVIVEKLPEIPKNSSTTNKKSSSANKQYEALKRVYGF